MEDVHQTCQAELTCLQGLFSGHTLDSCASAQICAYMLHTASSPTEVSVGVNKTLHRLNIENSDLLTQALYTCKKINKGVNMQHRCMVYSCLLVLLVPF